MWENKSIENAYPECEKAAASAGKLVCDRLPTSLRGRAPCCERLRPLLGNAVCTFAGFLMFLGSLCFVVQVRSSRMCETRTGILKISCSFGLHAFKLLRNSNSRFIPSVLCMCLIQSISLLCKLITRRLIFMFRKKNMWQILLSGVLMCVTVSHSCKGPGYFFQSWNLHYKFNYVSLSKEGLPSGSVLKESVCSAGDMGSISGSGRSPGGGYGNPLQCSCLENSMGREPWWATVRGVTKNLRLDWVPEHTHNLSKDLFVQL